MRIVGAISALSKNTQCTLPAAIAKALGEKHLQVLFSTVKELDVRK